MIRLSGFGSRTLCILAILVLLEPGCGPRRVSNVVPPPDSKPADLTPLPARPAPGQMITYPPEPIALQSRWKWHDLWLPHHDLKFCSLHPFGLSPDANKRDDSQFVAGDFPNSFVFAFDIKTCSAEDCRRFRVHLAGTEYAGFWWARVDDIQGKGYPFQMQRFRSFKKVEPGVFEVDFDGSDKPPEWSGGIRLIRVDVYCARGDAVVLNKLEADLTRGCRWVDADPLKADFTQDEDALGAAFVQRAAATGSLSDLRSSADFLQYSKLPGTSECRTVLLEMCKERSMQLLESRKSQEALYAFSAAAGSSENPVEFLYDLLDRLNETQRAALWPAEPYVTIQSFESRTSQPFFQWAEKAGRTVDKNESVTDVALDGATSVHLAISDPSKEANSWYTLGLSIPVSEKPFGIRFRLRQAKPSSTKGIILAYLPAIKDHSYLAVNLEPTVQDDGWQCVELKSDIYQLLVSRDKNQLGRDISGASVGPIGLGIQGPANEFWVDRVDIFIPNGQGTS